MYQIVALVATFFIGAASLQASGIVLSQSIDRTEVGYDDLVKLEIILRWEGPPQAYLIDGPLRPKLDRLKVASSSSTVSIDGKGENEKTTKTFRFFLEPTSSGIGRIERMEINYLSLADSIPGSMSTDPLEVKIGRPALSSSREQDSFSWPLFAAVGTVLLGALGGGMFYLRSRNAANAEPERLPKDELLENLAELKAKSSSDHKQFQTGLYRLLVTYLTARIGSEREGLSCEAIIKELAETDMPLAERDKISRWLRQAEKEKYSPAGAPPGETTRIESEVREFFQSIKS